MSNTQSYKSGDAEYSVRYRTEGERTRTPSRRRSSHVKRSRPKSMSGIHRRHVKKIRW